MTKSQIGQAFGNDVLERSRPCHEPHVHSFKVAMGCTCMGNGPFHSIWCIKKSLLADVDNIDLKPQTDHLLCSITFN